MEDTEYLDNDFTPTFFNSVLLGIKDQEKRELAKAYYGKRFYIFDAFDQEGILLKGIFDNAFFFCIFDGVTYNDLRNEVWEYLDYTEEKFLFPIVVFFTDKVYIDEHPYVFNGDKIESKKYWAVLKDAYKKARELAGPIFVFAKPS